MQCIECLRGFHAICGEPCCCNNNSSDSDSVSRSSDSPDEDGRTRDQSRQDRQSSALFVYDTSDPEEDWRVSEGNAKRGKRDASLKDQQSTGRKRAAKLFPLDRSAPCEWAAASESNPCGGGKHPLTFGCENLQSHRHHGPDKNTLNNEEGNVHRICSFHHNWWHAKNDEEYDPRNPHGHEE